VLHDLGIGEERHEEDPSQAMVATVASPCDFGAVMGSSVIELEQEGSGRGESLGRVHSEE
jgi:hypothetical protein